MKARGNIVIAPLTFYTWEVNGQLDASAALFPGKGHYILFESDTGWASVPVRTLWRREKCLSPYGNRAMISRSIRLYCSH